MARPPDPEKLASLLRGVTATGDGPPGPCLGADALAALATGAARPHERDAWEPHLLCCPVCRGVAGAVAADVEVASASVRRFQSFPARRIAAALLVLCTLGGLAWWLQMNPIGTTYEDVEKEARRLSKGRPLPAYTVAALDAMRGPVARAVGGPVALFPCESELETDPEFVFIPAFGVTRHRVAIYTSDGTELGSAFVPTTLGVERCTVYWPFPAATPKLLVGRAYVWEVKPDHSDSVDSRTFVVKPWEGAFDADSDRIGDFAAPALYPYLMAHLCLADGYLRLAEDSAEKAVRRNPRSTLAAATMDAVRRRIGAPR